MNDATHTYHPARTLITLLIVLLGLSAMLGSAGAWSDLQQITMLRTAAESGITVQQELANDVRQALIALAQVGVLLLTAVVWLFWNHRANRNARALGAADQMRFSPGWSVGWWFVPFANLVKPFQAVREVWVMSEPDEARRGHSDSKIVGFWWAAWIGSGIAGRVSGRMVIGAESIDQMILASWVSVIAAVATVLAAGMAIMVVRSIRDRQELRAERLAGMNTFVPDAPPVAPPMGTSAGIPQAPIHDGPYIPGAPIEQPATQYRRGA